MAAKKRSKKQIAEWSLLSFKGITTIVGVVWAYRTYKKRQAVADAQRAAAERMTGGDVAADAANRLVNRYL